MFGLSTLTIVIIAFILGVSAAGVISAFITVRKNGEPITNAWIKIRPIISEVLIEGIKVYQANELGYDALVAYCVAYTKNKVDTADFLTQEEKDMLTVEFIKGVLEPQLKKLWDKKMFQQLA